jgi:hypothetical protein
LILILEHDPAVSLIIEKNVLIHFKNWIPIFPSKFWDGFSIQFAGEAIPGRKLYWQPQHGLADIKVAG